MSFTGKGFIRCDDALVEGIDANAFVDSFADFKIRHNEKVLYRDAHPITFVPLSGNSTDNEDSAGVRPAASLRRTTWLQVPWVVYPGLTKVRLRVFAHIADAEAEALNVDMWVGLRGLGSKKASLAPQTTPQATAYVIEWELDAPLTQPATTDLHIDVRSRPASAQVYQTASDGRATGPLFETVGPDSSMYPVSYTAQSEFDPALQFTQVWPDGNAPERRYDHLLVPANGFMWIRPSSPGATLPFADEPEIWAMSYICIRSVAVEFLYEDGTQGGGQYRELPAAVYRANQVVGAAESGQHVDNIIGIHKRPRCLYVGPRGKAPPSETGWPTGYSEKFVRVFDDSVSGGVSNELLVDSGPIKPASSGSIIRAELNFLPYHYVNRYVAGDDAPDTSRAVWDLTLYIEQFDTSTGAWVDVGNETESVVMFHSLTDQSGRWTSLLCEQLRVRNYRDASPSGDSYVYKEGLLYPEDLELVRRESMEVLIDFDGIEEQDLLRFRLTAQLQVTAPDDPVYSDDSSTTEQTNSGVSGDTYQDYEWLVLMLTGSTLWEVPQ